MAYKSVMVPSKIFAKDIDSLNRWFKSAVDLENGNIITLNGGISNVSGEQEVWTASTPAAATDTDLWMVGEPEVVVTNAQYKGLDPDPRNFYIPAGTIGTAFKVKKFDIVRITAEGFTNTRSTEGYVGIGTTGAKLTWQASSTNAKFRFVETTTLALPSGAPGSNRVTIYRLEAIAE